MLSFRIQLLQGCCANQIEDKALIRCIIRLILLIHSVVMISACGSTGSSTSVAVPVVVPVTKVAVSKIAFIGDSITRGTYCNYSTPYKYTSYANRFKQSYSNTDIQAIDGSTTQYWIEKLPEVKTKYDLVIVMLGVNDSGLKLSPESYISNLKQIKNLLGCRVIFISPTPLYSYWEEQNKIISSYANAIKTEFPDTYIDLTKLTFTKADYFSDDVHLLDSGHTKIFNKLMDYVNLHFILSP